MTITRELRISVGNVLRVVITCASCEGEVILDIAKSSHIDHVVPNVAGGALCPLCGEPFGQELRNAILKIEETFKALKGLSRHSISFCVAESAILKDVKISR